MNVISDGQSKKKNAIFDSHFHIIDYRFPLVPNQSYTPSEFTVLDYLKRVQSCGITGGAVVSGSFQAFDQTYLIDALQALGPNFVGVTQLPATTPDEEIIKLHEQGIRAVRFNLKRGGSEQIYHLKSFAQRIYAIAGWHVELYVDSVELYDLMDLLSQLPAVSIDHLGLSKSGFLNLLHLVEKGVKVKASGFGRLDFDVPWALNEVMTVNPRALLFGTDLPSTRAPRPFLDNDIALVRNSLSDEWADRVLFLNAMDFYIRCT